MFCLFGRIRVAKKVEKVVISNSYRNDIIYRHKFGFCDIHSHKTGNVLFSLDIPHSEGTGKLCSASKCHSAGAFTVVGAKPKLPLKLVTANADNRMEMNETCSS